MRGRVAAAIGAAVVLGAAAVCPAGVVQTRGERMVGPVAVRAGGLTVGERAAVAGEVLFALFDRPGETFRQPNTVRMTNGEAWHCDVLALAADKLTIRSNLFGTKEVQRASVRALEFQAKLPPEAGLEAQTLYRRRGEPLPGAMLWISPTQIAVDSPLGAIAMDRKGVTRFILSTELTLDADDGEAEVVLVDGSVLKGKLTLAAGQVRLRHAMLGELHLPAKVVRSVLCHAADVAYVTQLPFEARSTRLVAAAEKGDTVRRRLPGEASAHAPGSVQSLCIQPATTVTFRLAGQSSGGRVLRASVSAVDSARGAARLRVRAAGRVAFEKEISASPKAPEWISVALGESAEITIEVAFGASMRFPCGVVLGDPHVVANSR